MALWLQIIIIIYLLLGIAYVIFLAIHGRFLFWSLPINILGGPILAAHYFIKYYFKKNITPANIRHKDILKDKKAVFFDLDGTIWDSSEWWIGAIEDVGKDNNIPNLEVTPTYLPGVQLTKTWKVLQSYNGFKMPPKKDFKMLARETEIKVIEMIKNADYIEYIDGFENLAFHLKFEKGMKVALVTNASREVVEALDARNNFSHLTDLIMTGDDISQKKPSPAIFLKAARKLHVRPKEVLVFEDSVSGSTAAARAGMDQAIIWRTDFPQSEYKGNIYGFFPDFVGLPEFMAKPARQRVLEEIERLHELKEKPQN